jgi:hypothetical protein
MSELIGQLGTYTTPLISGAGNRAALRFLEFFIVNIRNRNTRAAYGRAAAEFLRWCEGHGIDALGRVHPVHVAAYVEQLAREMSAPSVKPGRISRRLHRPGESLSVLPIAARKSGSLRSSSMPVRNVAYGRLVHGAPPYF